MPKYLKLTARFVDSGLVVLFVVLTIVVLQRSSMAAASFPFAIAVVLAFNLYLIEKAAMLLSEEEWLKGQVRKVLLRRKLARLQEEEAAAGTESDTERKLHEKLARLEKTGATAVTKPGTEPHE